MKKTIVILLLFLSLVGLHLSAQQTNIDDNYKTALNIGAGIGGYSKSFGSIGQPVPVLNINYQFYMADNFSVAPFFSFYTYKTDHFRGVVIPAGVKCAYFLDQLINTGKRWDFYLAGSLGFSIVNLYWESNYPGSRDDFSGPKPVFCDLHLGIEYHINKRVGAFLDFSTGASTIGFAFH